MARTKIVLGVFALAILLPFGFVADVVLSKGKIAVVWKEYAAFVRQMPGDFRRVWRG